MRDAAKEFPELSERYSRTSNEIQCLGYPKYAIGQRRPDPLLMFLARKQRQVIKLTRLATVSGGGEDPSRELVELKELLVHRESLIREGITKRLQESPRLYETLPKLAAIAESEGSAELTEAIRKVAKPIGKGALFHKVITDVDAVQSKCVSILREAGSCRESRLKDSQFVDAVETMLDKIKSIVEAADEIQDHERGALARLLNTPDRRNPLGADVINRIEGIPFQSRLISSRALILLAEELKQDMKDQSLVDLLQETAIALFKESLELAVDGLYGQALCDMWSEPLRSLRILNPARFDLLFTDQTSLGIPE